MATNTTLQYLEGTGEDAFGNSVSLGSKLSNRRQIETFIADEAIASGDAVSFDLSETADGAKVLKVVKADSGTATDRCCIGIAITAASTAGDKVDVCLAGPCEANVDGATVAGNLLQISATAGRLEPRTVAVNEGGAATFNLYPIVAIATEADTSNVATVIVYKQF